MIFPITSHSSSCYLKILFCPGLYLFFWLETVGYFVLLLVIIIINNKGQNYNLSDSREVEDAYILNQNDELLIGFMKGKYKKCW